MRTIDGAASAAAFIAATASVGFLSGFGQPNTLVLALVSTLIVAGAIGMLRVPAPFEARFSRSVDWWLRIPMMSPRHSGPMSPTVPISSRPVFRDDVAQS